MTAAVQRRDVHFTSGSDRCHAWLYLPEHAAAGPAPVIVMAHGIGGIKAVLLDVFAERFRDAGYACLVFDYRHFGESTGEPRQLVDISSQQEDWRNAIGFARTLPELDPDQVVAWGTSFGGGHVIFTAARDHRLAAAIAQVPFTDGMATAKAIPIKTGLPLMARAVRDTIAARRGLAPVLVATSAEPGGVAMMSSPDAEPGRIAIEAAATDGAKMPSHIPARIALHLGSYSPGRRTKDIQCPILFCIVEQDSVTPASTAVHQAAQAPRGEIRLYDAGHFDPYVGDLFDQVTTDQINFLHKHVPVHAPPVATATATSKKVKTR